VQCDERDAARRAVPSAAAGIQRVDFEISAVGPDRERFHLLTVCVGLAVWRSGIVVRRVNQVTLR